ncbi:hypothetical protein M422DRAFT_43205 [Sphaerobolus stellatus SS14]|nr:hypothetical protein M422DRAFT_43205 [Sphaerobolus stellatus SS14]
MPDVVQTNLPTTSTEHVTSTSKAIDGRNTSPSNGMDLVVMRVGDMVCKTIPTAMTSKPEEPVNSDDDATVHDTACENDGNPIEDKNDEGEGDEEEEGEEEEEPPSWDISPFIFTNRKQWAVHPTGVMWLWDKLHELDNLAIPKGLPPNIHKARMKKKLADQKKDIAKRYIDKFPNFKWESVTGNDSSKKAESLAQNRVFVKIGRLFTQRSAPPKPQNMFDLIFVKDMWAQNQTEEGNQAEREEMFADGWHEEMSRHKTLPLQVKVRKCLFQKLSLSEQRKWARAVACWHPTELSRLPDSKSGMLKEGWFTPSDQHTIAFRTLKEYKAADIGFTAYFASKCEVTPEEVQVLEPFKPHVADPVYIPKDVLLLKDTVDIKLNDTSFKILSSLPAIKKALDIYFSNTYALVPLQNGHERCAKSAKPLWDAIDQEKGAIGDFVELDCLPTTPGFRFSAPNHMADEDVMLITEHIIQGELGKIAEHRQFQWVSQRGAPAWIAPMRNEAVQEAPVRQAGAQPASSMDINTPGGAADDDAKPAKEKRKPRPTKPAIGIMKGEASVSMDVRKQLVTSGDTSNNAKVSTQPCATSVGILSADHSPDIVAESQLLVTKGLDGPQFKGDWVKWVKDFRRREMVLEWEEDMRGEMGASAVAITRFIEAVELEEDYKCSAFLDVGAPVSNIDDAGNALMDVVWDVDKPLPFSHQALRRVTTWAPFLASIMKRVQGALLAIVSHPTDASGRRLRLGGGMGALGILRLVEFVRRVLQTRHVQDSLGDEVVWFNTELNKMMCDTEVVLGQEMWRRWASGSFTESPNGGAGQVGELWLVWMEARVLSSLGASNWFECRWGQNHPLALVETVYCQACVRDRHFDPKSMVAEDSEGSWAAKEVVAGMQGWEKLMDEETFAIGSVVDVFAWTYSWYMMAGFGKCTNESCNMGSTIKGVTQISSSGRVEYSQEGKGQGLDDGHDKCTTNFVDNDYESASNAHPGSLTVATNVQPGLPTVLEEPEEEKRHEVTTSCIEAGPLESVGVVHSPKRVRETEPANDVVEDKGVGYKPASKRYFAWCDHNVQGDGFSETSFSNECEIAEEEYSWGETVLGKRHGEAASEKKGKKIKLEKV